MAVSLRARRQAARDGTRRVAYARSRGSARRGEASASTATRRHRPARTPQERHREPRGRIGQEQNVLRSRSRVSQGAQRRLEESKTYRAMGESPEGREGNRQPAGGSDQHGACIGGLATDLAPDAGNRQPHSRSHRESHRLCHRRELSQARRRQPGDVVRPLGSAARQQEQSAEGQARGHGKIRPSSCPALRGRAAVHASAAAARFTFRPARWSSPSSPLREPPR